MWLTSRTFFWKDLTFQSLHMFSVFTDDFYELPCNIETNLVSLTPKDSKDGKMARGGGVHKSLRHNGHFHS